MSNSHEKIVEDGVSWQKHPDEFLVGYAASYAAGGPDAGAIEMQRRLKNEIRTFNESATGQVAELVRVSTEAGRQADTMIRLTWAIIALTVVLGLIAAVQLWAMLVKGA